MTRERLNPYLVLGIPYAAPIKEVHKGFAKRARAIRNEEFDSYLLEDLTWAKHQIEQAERDPELDLTMYRVPANSEAFKNDLPESFAMGFFNPPVKRIEKVSVSPSTEERNVFLFSALNGWLAEMINEGKVELIHPFERLASE